MHQKSYDLSMR